ncbi:MAG: baseplate assembly protein [Nannocystaceae bacterium]|nr:baseplate assembly protein [Nannocystaceae bacterium]
MTTKYYGKYRGSVISSLDLMRMGRLQVSCSAVFGPGVLAWAMPCVPFAGPLEGFYMLPKPGSNVWVEFEAGDPDRPIWAGCFWTTQTIPPKAVSPSVRTISGLGADITIDDTPGAGSVTMQVLPPAVSNPCTMRLDATGVLINVGGATIKMTTPNVVDINIGALTVT